jgi:hypothetical protein
MDFLKKVTQKVVEMITLKEYLHNEGTEFVDSLLDSKITEPTDIRYNNTNYQITIGDQEAVEERRRTISKEGKYVGMRGILNIAHLLLSSALTKKSIGSDPDTILLIEVTSTGGRDWGDLEDQLNSYTSAHPEARGKWKKIYAVFPEKNIQLFK